MIRDILLAVVGLATLSEPASAQVTGATELKIAVPVRGAPGKKPVADIYYLIGETGAKETYTFSGKGPASLTLFGPDGSEILSASGSGTVKLEAVLPFTDAFTVAVARKMPAQAYTLSRKATVPTLTEALQAAAVGYAQLNSNTSQCWVIPGVKLRLKFPDGIGEQTIAADRTTVSWFVQSKGGAFAGEVLYKYVDGKIRKTTRYSDGLSSDATIELRSQSFDAARHGKATGYLCASTSK